MDEMRKRNFRAALALSGLTQEQFAETADVTPSHLSRVLNGERISASLMGKMDAFIASYLPERVA